MPRTDTIITGRTTEEKENDAEEDSHSTFKGLWNTYLAGLWNKTQAESQVKVCDYNYMEHEEIWRRLSWTVKARRTGCSVINSYQLTEWHP